MSNDVHFDLPGFEVVEDPVFGVLPRKGVWFISDLEQALLGAATHLDPNFVAG